VTASVCAVTAVPAIARENQAVRSAQVVVDETSGRFNESGAGRSVFAGVSASLSF
jgi:hypothetical protein